MNGQTLKVSGTAQDAEAPGGPVARQLQTALVLMVDLQLQAKQAHWNVVGRGFRPLHTQLDDLVDLAREYGDTFAERTRALGSYPDARAAAVAAASTLLPAPAGARTVEQTARAMSTRLRQVSESLREGHVELQGRDAPTADLFNQAIVELEKHAWMFESEVTPPRSTCP